MGNKGEDKKLEEKMDNKIAKSNKGEKSAKKTKKMMHTQAIKNKN